jgi:hypothetical protein
MEKKRRESSVMKNENISKITKSYDRVRVRVRVRVRTDQV